jgi:peptide/nickel transport system substrate-binding protein
MKYIKLLTIIATCLLVTSIFSVIPVFSMQPPIDTSTYYIGTIGQPARLDPGRAYDTASGEIIQNVYQTLIWFSDKHPLTLISGEDHNLTQLEHSLLTTAGFGPVIATALPTITDSGYGVGKYWNFTINPNARFQTWIGPTGSVQARKNVTTDDVVYSFRIQMVFDSPYAPVWMWETVAFNFMSFDASYSFPDDEAIVGKMISEWCYKDPDHPLTNVIFNFTYPLPTAAMYQIFAQTWGSIVNKDFFIAHGCWDGSFASGWSKWRQTGGTGNRSPIDRYISYSSYTDSTPGVGKDVPDMCGTGPYKYTYGAWDTISKTWRLDADVGGYWKDPTFANAGQKNGNYIHIIISKGYDTWPTRKMLLLNGEIDSAVVPRANMYDLLVGTDKYKPLPGLTLVTNISGLTNEEIFYCFNVSTESAYQSYVGYPNHVVSIGADALFFNDVHIRRAFAWALDYTQIIAQAWFGEAIQQASWWVDGLVPSTAKNTAITMRNVDLNMIKSELAQAALIDGHNISTEGFETTMIYNTGNDQRMIELNSIAAAFATIGSQYRCNVMGLDWPVFLDNMNAMNMPIFCLGWLADYADPSNWASPYQSSAGSFLYTQGPPFPANQTAVDDAINAAAADTDPVHRDAMYKDLQYQYWLDVPSVPVVQPVGRRFARDWLQGWYYNDLYPGVYPYDLWKAAPISYEDVDLDVSDSISNVTSYDYVYVSYGKMNQYKGGGQAASMTFSVFVKRKDSNHDVEELYAEVGLVRTNLTSLQIGASYPSFQGPTWANPGGPSWYRDYRTGSEVDFFIPTQSPMYPTSMFVLLGPGGNVTVMLTWYEDGISSALPANATWAIGTLVAIGQTDIANDINLTNNAIGLDPATYKCIALTLTDEVPHGSSTYDRYIAMIGDIDGDGCVKILDAIDLSSAFGKSFGQAGYLKEADTDSNGTVNILDAVNLSGNFGKKVGP